MSSAATTPLNTFNWLIVLGFPTEIAAAKALPEIFTHAAPPTAITDGVRVFMNDAA